MSPPTVTWTPQQRTAITQRGKDLLVTASAGTGKTAVLSQRCLDILCEPNTHTSVLNMLILTFTDAAAQEMRTRIRTQLTQAAAGDRRLRHLQREVMRLPGARISTIHAFCKQVITEHFHTLGLDPGFRLIDTDEQRLLKTEALEKTLDWAWTQDDLLEGLHILFYKRALSTTHGFALKIVDLSNDLDNVLDREQWYARALALAQSSASINGPVADLQKEWIGEQFMALHVQLSRIVNDYHAACGTNNPKALSNQHLLDTLDQCLCAEQGDDWDAVVEAYHAFAKKSVLKPKDVEPDVAVLLQNRLREVVTAFVALGDWAVLQKDYFERVEPRQCIQTETMLTLTQAFDRFYAQAKQQINCLDFSDLEHYALKLLVQIDPETGQTSPTPTALALRGQFHHVFVDEYQDVNPVQEAIIESLHQGANLFVVGDIKQSIYAFRGARPHIFQNRLDQVGSPDHAQVQRVDLNMNFRSNPGVLDATNRICKALMTQETSGMEYDEGAWLNPPSRDGKSDVCVEWHILGEPETADSDGQVQNVTSRQRQAALIARRILQLTGRETGQAVQVYDKTLGRQRDARLGDIAILFRSPAKRVDEYIGVLRQAGLAVSSSQSSGYFSATEIRDCINVLQVLDNPQRDIELAAVLRGPFFHVTDNDLVRIKLASDTHKRQGFYDQVLAYVQKGEDQALRQRLDDILISLARWRHQASEGSLSQLIWTLIRETGFLSAVQAMPGGAVRKANLLKLHDRAIQFEGFASSRGAVSLRRFVEFVEQLQEAGVDWSNEEPHETNEHAVQLASVHKSKGLEYPIVFLAELNTPFSQKDTTDPVLMHERWGLGMQMVEPDTDARLDGLGHQVIAEIKAKQTVAEELRVLYVALTRARERLILCACLDQEKCVNIVQARNPYEPVSLVQLRTHNHAQGWLLLALADDPALQKALDLHETPTPQSHVNVTFYEQAALNDLSRQVAQWQEHGCTVQGGDTSEITAQWKSNVREALAWQYPHQALTTLPSKRTVSQLVHSDPLAVKNIYDVQRTQRTIKLDTHDKRTASAIGTATHLVLAHLDLHGPVTKPVVNELIESLIEKGTLDRDSAALIQISAIVRFFDSDLGRLAQAHADQVLREWPFTMGLDLEQIKAYGFDIPQTTEIGERITVQGIADLIIVTPKEHLIVDFKTDRVKAQQVAERSKLYETQLKLYAQAVQGILSAADVRTTLYFLQPGMAVNIDLK